MFVISKLKIERDIVIYNLLVAQTYRLITAPGTGITESSLYANKTKYDLRSAYLMHIILKPCLCLYAAVWDFLAYSLHITQNLTHV